MSKYAVMTECRDLRQDWDNRDRNHMKKFKNAVFFVFVYIPVMTLIGGVLILGYMPL